MVSNTLSGRPFFPRPPVVCISPPYDPGFAIQLLLFFQELQVCVDGIAWFEWWGSNTLRLKGEPVACVWDWDGGTCPQPPVTKNRMDGYGIWRAPVYEGVYTIKCKATWQDTTVAFAESSILVVEPFP